MSNFFKRNKNNDDNTKQIAEFQELIAKLKSENASLGAETASYRKREREITDALALAKAQADEYVEEAKMQFKLEYERLAKYRRQWQGYVDNLQSAESLGKEILRTNAQLKQVSQELFAKVHEDLQPPSSPSDPQQDMDAEAHRLSPDLQDSLTGEDICALIKQLV